MADDRSSPPEQPEKPDPFAAFAPWVEMALASIQREYPYHLSVPLGGTHELALPQQLTPAFRGAYDWHSSVHSHWLLVRAARECPGASWGVRVRTTLARSLSESNLQAEDAFLRTPGREGWERPYGLAWLLQLAAELRGWDDPAGRYWIGLLEPLETLASARMLAWLDRLPYPVRSGEHSQSAFALGLFFDWARDRGLQDLCGHIAERAIRLYGGDREAPVRYEPSAQDFLSPLLGEADLMRRALPRSAFAPWLARFLPAAGSPDLARWLTPVASPDRADGKFAHLDGLNLSRAWMLEGVCAALEAGNELRPVLLAAARTHRSSGLEGASGTHYMGTHWLGSFVVYLISGRGLG